MKNKKARNIFITVFVIVWTLLFHYESTRHFYLEPALNIKLPKTKFLFPPAGWIMFYNVDDSFAFASVIGVNKYGFNEIDPHYILATRTFGFDNIHRGILGNILYAHVQEQACAFLERKFPVYDGFLISLIAYPSVTKHPDRNARQVVYKCGDLSDYVRQN